MSVTGTITIHGSAQMGSTSASLPVAVHLEGYADPGAKDTDYRPFLLAFEVTDPNGRQYSIPAITELDGRLSAVYGPIDCAGQGKVKHGDVIDTDTVYLVALYDDAGINLLTSYVPGTYTGTARLIQNLGPGVPPAVLDSQPFSATA